MPERVFANARFAKLMDDTMGTIIQLRNLKGGEYSGDVDCLDNFRRAAIDNRVPMELVWRIYAGKHWDSIRTYVNDLLTGNDRERSEPLEGRVDDLILYLLLFKAMLLERKEGSEPPPAPLSVTDPDELATLLSTLE